MGKVRYNQGGYVGSSMSCRAVEAYDSGEMPKSKWTKTAILQGIAEVLYWYDVPEEKINMFSKMKKNELFSKFVEWSSWHHTGKYANETDFYQVSEDNVMKYLKEIKAA